MEHNTFSLHRFLILLATLATLLICSGTNALAGDNDFKLERLCSNSGCSEQSLSDFKNLGTAYASILAPMHFQPASTLGQAGFEISLESKMSFSTEDASYWKATDKNQNQPASADGKYAAPDLFATVQLHMRKGLPFSFEVEGIVNWLANSELFYVGGGLRWAFTEGWWFMPDISVRAHVGTIVGNSELTLINVNMDVALSYTWGLGGICSITPYAGYSLLTSWFNSHPFLVSIDGEPTETVFGRQNTHLSRGFVGLELKGDYFVFDVEGEFGKQVMSVGVKIGANF